jgi:Icc-related predicted phosphoesterase
MKVQILSDIHLEFGQSAAFDFGGVDLLILAGDVHIGKKGLFWIRERVKNIPVIYVLGNHEYYRSSYPRLLHQLQEEAAGTNVHILEKGVLTLDGITFHGTTLWTNFELFGDPRIAGYACQQSLNDYRLIRLDPAYSRLRSRDTHVLHYQSLGWLRNSLRNTDTAKNVVITHHAPSPRSLPQQYQNDLVAAGYASDLEAFIKETKPDLWIHGHVHEPFDYYIGETRIICNPHGYVHEPYNGYKAKLIIELSSF